MLHLVSSSPPGNPRNIGEEQQVIAGTGAWVEAVLPAQRETHVTARPLRVSDSINAVHGEATAGGSEQGRAHLHGRRFARTVGAEKGMNFTGADAKRHPVDGGKGTFACAKDAAKPCRVKNCRHRDKTLRCLVTRSRLSMVFAGLQYVGRVR